MRDVEKPVIGMCAEFDLNKPLLEQEGMVFTARGKHTSMPSVWAGIYTVEKSAV